MASQGLTGVGQVLAALRARTTQIEKAIAVGVYAEGQNIIGDAKDNCPVNFGTLRRSLYCTEPTTEAGEIHCDIGGGGPAGAYIVRQHEGDFKHAVGTRKFLEKAVNTARADYVRNVGAVALASLGNSPQKSNVPTRPDNPEAIAASKRGEK